MIYLAMASNQYYAQPQYDSADVFRSRADVDAWAKTQSADYFTVFEINPGQMTFKRFRLPGTRSDDITVHDDIAPWTEAETIDG